MASQKILVIDDSRVIRMRVKEMLPAGNIQVLEAGDGVEGLNMIRSENPNLIMLDFLLPRKSGWDVYQEIIKSPDLLDVPLVIMSGRKEEVTEKLNEPFERFAFVGKPFEKKQLVAAIQESMKKAKDYAAKHKDKVTAGAAAGTDTGGMAAEIKALNAKVAKMQGEIDTLKKQITQLVGFIKQKLK
ncbi:MAG: response regulator [Chroococcales cyanobacterium]